MGYTELQNRSKQVRYDDNSVAVDIKADIEEKKHFFQKSSFVFVHKKQYSRLTMS